MGAQCSCGTWLTPAIQVPLSKVDIVNPCTANVASGFIHPVRQVQDDKTTKHGIVKDNDIDARSFICSD